MFKVSNLRTFFSYSHSKESFTRAANFAANFAANLAAKICGRWNAILANFAVNFAANFAAKSES